MPADDPFDGAPSNRSSAWSTALEYKTAAHYNAEYKVGYQAAAQVIALDYEASHVRARGENSHLGFLTKSARFDAWRAFANHGTASGSEAARQETAPGVCIYLYAHSDPVNGIDPSGNMTVVDLLGSMGIQGNFRNIKDGAALALRREVRQSADDFVNTFSLSDNDTHKENEAAATTLWSIRLKSKGLKFIKLAGVSQHGPDGLVCGYLGGRPFAAVVEIKGTRKSRVLGLLDRVADGALQMSANWIDRHTERIIDATLRSVAPEFSGAAREIVDRMLSNGEFSFYLLRAKDNRSGMWSLQGYRLLHVGGNDVAKGGMAHPEIESEEKYPFASSHGF